MSVLVAVGVGEDGFRDILGVAEGCKEDKAGWGGFLAYLKQRGLKCPELIISDKCMGLIESIADYYPDAKGSVVECISIAMYSALCHEVK